MDIGSVSEHSIIIKSLWHAIILLWLWKKSLSVVNFQRIVKFAHFKVIDNLNLGK